MTIGIAVSGPGAGLAAFRALAAVEKVTRGAIGGFVSFAVITDEGKLERAETQRGGTATLFTDGESTGTPPPLKVSQAPLAVLMSSGPDRPAPLSQFTPAHIASGLVTGHRLPNVGFSGRLAPNLALLERLGRGEDAKHATSVVLDAYPDADAGLIGLDLDGQIGLGNTVFAGRRKDLGMALIETAMGSAGILHNAIHPIHGLAEFSAGVALDSLAPADRSDFEILFRAPTPITLGDDNSVIVNEEGHIVSVQVTQQAWLSKDHQGAALNFNAAIRRDGCLLGYALDEPYCVASNGYLVSMSGRSEARVAARAVRSKS